MYSSQIVPSLGGKSPSLPNLTKPKLRQQTQDSPQRDRRQQLMHFHASHQIEDQLPFKVKLQARSMKKLQEKYDTIDRWKQRYIAQAEAQLATSSHLSHHPHRKLPVLSNLMSTIRSQALSGRKSEARVQGEDYQNMRMNDKGQIVEKEINYLCEGGQLVTIDKKREFSLKKLLLRADKDRKRNFSNGFIYQQMKLTQYPDKKQKWVPLLQSKKKDQEQQRKGLISDQSDGLQELKLKLMKEAIQSTPEGWNLKQESTQQIEETQSSFEL